MFLNKLGFDIIEMKTEKARLMNLLFDIIKTATIVRSRKWFW